MSAGTPDIGTGTTLTMDNVTIHLTSISLSSVSRESIETTHLGTTFNRTFIPSDLYDPGTIECEFITDSATPVTTHKIEDIMADVVTVWTIQVGAIAKWTGSGFVTDISFDFPTEELQTGSFTLKVSTAITTTNS